MKNLLYTLLIICLAHTYSFAQESSMEDSILYVTPQEEAFMIDKESKYLFKIQPLRNSLVDINRLRTFSFAFEQKLGTSFSISPIVNLDIKDNSFPGSKTTADLGFEFRYYYKLAELIKQKKQANNLSSNYFASSFITNLSTDRNWVFRGTNTFELAYGIQKRFLNYGYLDFRVNLGVRRSGLDQNSGIGPFRNATRNQFYLSTGTNVGIGLGKRYELSEEAKCPIFRCFSNRRSAFKINLNKTWSLSTQGDDRIYLYLHPNIIHEFKLGQSPISFEQDLDTWISFSNFRLNGNGEIKNSFGFDRLSLKYRAGFKYYHSLKSRIRNGQSGNNLSGLYIFGRGAYRFGQTLIFETNENGLITFKEVNYRNQAVQMGYGYQKEVLENLFFDINLGVSRGVGKNNLFDNGWGLVSDIKVGIML